MTFFLCNNIFHQVVDCIVTQSQFKCQVFMKIPKQLHLNCILFLLSRRSHMQVSIWNILSCNKVWLTLFIVVIA